MFAAINNNNFFKKFYGKVVFERRKDVNAQQWVTLRVRNLAIIDEVKQPCFC